MNIPQVTVPFVSQGSKEAMLSSEFTAIPITIDGAMRVTAGTVIKAPSLWARKTASPYKAKPFMQSAAIINPTNSTSATIDLADADAAKFRVADVVTFYDVSTGLMSGESLTISAIGAAGSGGTGETLITFTSQVWSTPPVATDRLCIADGTELAANAMVVLEDITIDGTNDVLSKGVIAGTFRTGAVDNVSYFDNTKAPNLQFVAIV